MISMIFWMCRLLFPACRKRFVTAFLKRMVVSPPPRDVGFPRTGENEKKTLESFVQKLGIGGVFELHFLRDAGGDVFVGEVLSSMWSSYRMQDCEKRLIQEDIPLYVAASEDVASSLEHRRPKELQHEKGGIEMF